MRRSSGTSSPEKRRVSIDEGCAEERSISPSPQPPQQILYTSPPNGYHQYSLHTEGQCQEQLPDDDHQNMMLMGSTNVLHSRKVNGSSPTGRRKEKSSARKVKRKGGKFWKRFYNRWVKGVAPSFSSLFLAVLLWYGLGVLSIGTSKLLLMKNDHHGDALHHRRHHHPLIGGVPPLFLSLQQLVIGAALLRLLLQIRCLSSPGLAPWPSQPLSVIEHGRWSRPATKWAEFMPSVNLQLVLSGIFFALGFLMTNYGFSGSSASFVETIKAAEPITSATVAVWWGIEVLSRNELIGLAAIVFGVVLSTVGNNSNTEAHEPEHHHSHAVWKSVQACVVVVLSNLCFSFRGLCQKLFRSTPEGSAQLVDDLNLQFRMQQTGIALLALPVLFWDGSKILRYLWILHGEHGLWSSGVTSRYVSLALLNGFAFAAYNLASTYILSRISVVHHAALNCVRRVFAIVITSLYFVVPITFLGSVGILVSFGGFMYFTHYKVQRQRQPKPLSSLLPVSLSQ
ncbi:hypothetical protein ACA910_000967 [Epithemia clementina (nom. ined.)]